MGELDLAKLLDDRGADTRLVVTKARHGGAARGIEVTAAVGIEQMSTRTADGCRERAGQRAVQDGALHSLPPKSV